MRTKIVYCLVSDIKDYYYEQLLISLCSLRIHNPDAEVEIICDKSTYATLKDKRSTIYEYNLKVTPIETPLGWGKWERSRYLKTNLRLLIKGDYLFLDVDTIICSSLYFIDNYTFDVGAVREGNLARAIPKHSQCKHRSEKWIWGKARLLNLDISGLWHYNSGVMYVKDTERAHELYINWSNKYSAQLTYGAKSDQLPLLITNHEMNNIITPLNHGMNCQVVFEEGRKLLPNINIIHYFPKQQKTILSSPWLLDPIKESGHLNTSIMRIIDEPNIFFSNLSRVIRGKEVFLYDKISLFETYSVCPQMIDFMMSVINVYMLLKIKLYKIMH